MNNTLEFVQKEFQLWRENRKKRVTIPDELWQKVFPLLNKYPISKICSALSLNTAQIKSKLGTPSIKNILEETLVKVAPILKASRTGDDICGVFMEITRKDGASISINHASISIKSFLNASLNEMITQFLLG